MASVLSMALVRKEVKYSCKYPSCKNSYYINNPPGSENKRFFRFPTDPAVRKIWKDICEISPSKNVNNFHLCIDHFTASDFSKNSIKGHLYKTAVPQLSNSHDETRSSKFQPRCLFPDNLPQLQTVNTTPSSIATNVPVRDNSTALNSTQSSSKSYEFLLADHDYAAHLNPQGSLTVTFVETHVGHDDDPGTKRLSKSQEHLLVEKLAAGVDTRLRYQDDVNFFLQEIERPKTTTTFEDRKKIAKQEFDCYVETLTEDDFDKFMAEFQKLKNKIGHTEHISKKRKVEKQSYFPDKK